MVGQNFGLILDKLLSANGLEKLGQSSLIYIQKEVN